MSAWLTKLLDHISQNGLSWPIHVVMTRKRLEHSGFIVDVEILKLL